MSILTCAMTDTIADTCNAQLNAITDPRNLFGQWKYSIALTSPIPSPSVVPSAHQTSAPMIIHPLSSTPCVSLPTPKPSAAPTKEPHVQTDRSSPRSPIVVPTLAPTLQHTSRPPRLNHPRSSDLIAHITHSHAPIPPPDDETVSH